MKNWKVRLLSYWLCLLGLSGCNALDLAQQQFAPLPPVNLATPVPAHPLYVMASAVGHEELLVVDPATWQIVRRSPLLLAGAWDFSRDPQGRIWLGYGAEPGVDEHVQVFAADGTLLKTFATCADPYRKIHFAAGRAFIPCGENGFQAAVVVVNLQTLAVQTKIDIRIDTDSFLLISSSGNEDYFVMVGNGDITNRVVLMDTHTLATTKVLPIPPSFPVRVLSYGQQFILLNSFPESPPAGRQDLLIIDTVGEPTVSYQQLPVIGALWGVIDGDALYTYHNIEQNGLRQDPSRSISRLDLRTYKSEVWSLPDHWNAHDLAIVNGEIILAHSIGLEPETSGLYRFNPTTGKFTFLVNIPNTQRILWAAP